SVTRRANSSATERCTMKRFAAVQAWPMLRNFACSAPSTAASRSASSNTTNGALPPSSIEVRSTPGAAWDRSFRPTSVEPVKESLRSRGSARIGSETALEELEVTTLTTPSGNPASSSSATKSSAVSGVSCAGLTTPAQPAASAGASSRVAIASGQSHGQVGKHDATAGLHPHRLLAEPAQELAAVGHLAPGLGQRLAHLERHQQREVLGPLGEQVEGPPQQLAPLPGRGPRPVGEGVRGGVHCGLRV